MICSGKRVAVRDLEQGFGLQYPIQLSSNHKKNEGE